MLKSHQLIDNVGSVLVSTKVAGEKTSTFRSDSFNLTLEWLPSSKMSGARIKSAFSAVALPSAKVLFGAKAEGAQPVCTQVRERGTRKEMLRHGGT